MQIFFKKFELNLDIRCKINNLKSSHSQYEIQYFKNTHFNFCLYMSGALKNIGGNIYMQTISTKKHLY